MAQVLFVAALVALVGVRFWLGIQLARHLDELPEAQRQRMLRQLSRSAY